MYYTHHESPHTDAVCRCSLLWLALCCCLASCCQVRVNESQVKNRLYMGNLPRSMTQLQLEDALKQELQGERHRLLMARLYASIYHSTGPVLRRGRPQRKQWLHAGCAPPLLLTLSVFRPGRQPAALAPDTLYFCTAC
jgi:hypothetical protein